MDLLTIVVSLSGLVVIAALLWWSIHSPSSSSLSVASQQRWSPAKSPGTPKTGCHYVITGGHGFLGSWVVETLLARGETNITIFDQQASSLFNDSISAASVRVVLGSILSPSDLTTLFSSVPPVDVVIHCAASVDFWSRLPFQLSKLYAINVIGTEYVLTASRDAGVKRFIFTSSAMVFVSQEMVGKQHRLLDEHTPYAKTPLCHYTTTKIQAEKLVLQSNSPPSFITLAVRYQGLFGPRDAFMVSQVADRLLGVSSENNRNDNIYVENAVHAILSAERAMTSIPEQVGGQAFHITNGDGGIGYQDFLKLAGSEWLTSVTRGHLPLPGGLRSLTPPVLTVARLDLTLSSAKAQRLLNYQPIYTVEEGIEQSAAFYSKLKKQNKLTPLVKTGKPVNLKGA